jgi:hypothetical protein
MERLAGLAGLDAGVARHRRRGRPVRGGNLGIITKIPVTLLRPESPKELRMFSRGPIAFVSLFLALLLAPPAHAADRTPADLVLVQQGTLPGGTTAGAGR